MFVQCLMRPILHECSDFPGGIPSSGRQYSIPGNLFLLSRMRFQKFRKGGPYGGLTRGKFRFGRFSAIFARQRKRPRQPLADAGVFQRRRFRGNTFFQNIRKRRQHPIQQLRSLRPVLHALHPAIRRAVLPKLHAPRNRTGFSRQDRSSHFFYPHVLVTILIHNFS